MPDMIDESRGVAAIFVVGAPAWHGKGKVLTHCLTAAQAIVEAEQDFEVEKWPLSACKPSGAYKVDADGWFATVRTDVEQVLGIVSGQYKVFQNREAFSFMDEVVQEGAAMWETAGCLDGGKRVWMLAKIPKEVKVTGKDVVNTYALLAMGHDGGMAVHVLPTTTRVVCQNTLNIALGAADKNKLVVRHTQSMKGKITLARHHLGVVHEKVDEFAHQAQALHAVSMKETQVKAYVEQFFPTRVKPDFTDGKALLQTIVASKQQGDDVVRDLLAAQYAETERIAKRNEGILLQILDNHDKDPAAGTAWGAYNAVGEYADHQKKYQSADSRLSSVWFGAGNDLKQEAYSAALAMAV
jgi:phage/plasmid-like protein (TIGR03299 family)